MFSMWIELLFTFFDFFGFHTETCGSNRKRSLKKFIIHIIWACTFTVFIISYSMQSIVLTEAFAYSANYIVQNINGMFTYWAIIVESYIQRKNQRIFWRVYRKIDYYRKVDRTFLRKYLMKFTQFFVFVTIIQIYFVLHFLSVNGYNFIFFRIGYFCFVAMYQCRAFYYLFFLELIKYELKRITSESKKMSIWSINIQNGYRIEKSMKNHIKHINQYYRLIYALSECINNIFGLSNLATILYCFHMPLTDFNWSLNAMHRQSDEYFKGNQ